MLFSHQSIYAADRVADAPNSLITIFQLLSHFFLFVAVHYAWRRNLVGLAIAGYGSCFVSVIYHACRGDFFCVGNVHPSMWRLADHITSLGLGGAVGLLVSQTSLARGNGPLVGIWASFVMPYLALVAVIVYPFDMRSGLCVAVFVIMVLFYRFIYATSSKRTDMKTYHENIIWWRLCVGLILLAAAMTCYTIDMPSTSLRGDSIEEGIMHILWHAFIGMAIYFIVSAYVSV